MPGKLKITGSTLTPRDPINVKAYCAGRLAAKNGDAAPTFGTVKTGVVASNNGLAWTAKLAGQGICVNLINPAGNSKPLVITTNGLQINVSLATNSSGVITTTAAQVITGVTANVQAARLVAVANDGASTGAAAVAAELGKYLTGSNMPQSADNAGVDAFIAGRASWTANPAGVGRDACALPYGGGYT